MQDISTSTLVFFLVVMVILSAYFSASETSMMTINRYRLRHLAKQGHRGACRAEKLLQNSDKLIGLILFGNNLVSILASSLATIIGMRLYSNVGVAFSTGLLTFFLLIFGEIVPKTIATRYPEHIAFPSTILLRPLLILASPLIGFFNIITKLLLACFGLSTEQKVSSHTLSKEELRTLLNEYNPLLPRKYKEMLLAIFDLDNMTVEDIMIPRRDILGIDINDDWRSNMAQLLHSPYSRMILYRDNLDNTVGMLRVREAYRLMLERNEIAKETLLRAADEVYFIPEGTTLNIQLMKFQCNKERIGIVVDEYGDIKGLVTVEDILEEIVGDFTTPFSSTLSAEIQYQKDGSILVSGITSIRDLNKIFNWSLPLTEFKTLNGLLLEHLGYIPSAGQSLCLLGCKFEILEVINNRIKQVKIVPQKYPSSKLNDPPDQHVC